MRGRYGSVVSPLLEKCPAGCRKKTAKPSGMNTELGVEGKKELHGTGKEAAFER